MTPNAYGLVDANALRTPAKKALVTVAKMLQNLANKPNLQKEVRDNCGVFWRYTVTGICFDRFSL